MKKNLSKKLRLQHEVARVLTAELPQIVGGRARVQTDFINSNGNKTDCGTCATCTIG